MVLRIFKFTCLVLLGLVCLPVVGLFALNFAVSRSDARAAELLQKLKDAPSAVAREELGEPCCTGEEHPRIVSILTGKITKQFEPYEWWGYRPSFAAPAGLVVYIERGRVTNISSGWD
jgi:hypothetical protein